MYFVTLNMTLQTQTVILIHPMTCLLISLSDDMVIDKSFLSLINTSDWNVESILGSSYEAEVDSLSDIVDDTGLNYEGFQETLDFTNKM